MKNASVKSYGSTRDRLSTNNSSKPPPLAPPRRASSNQSSDFVAHPPGVPRGTTNIDWANLSDEDKQVFFTWLDEFFARYLDLPASATRPTAPISAERPSNMSTPSPQSSPSLPPRRASTTRSSQITRPTPPDVLAPAQTPSISGRRNLPPAFSQQGPVCPLLTSVITSLAEMITAEDQLFHKTFCVYRSTTAIFARYIHQGFTCRRSRSVSLCSSLLLSTNLMFF